MQLPLCTRYVHWYVAPQNTVGVWLQRDKQANNIQWLDLSNLQMDPSWIYTLAGQGVRLAYRVSASLTDSTCFHLA